MTERLLIVADTHGAIKQVARFAYVHGPFTGLVHLGDYIADGELLSQTLGLPLCAVAGNGDGKHLLQELEIVVNNHKVLLVHGHHFDLSDESELLRTAKERDIKILLFGHTHRPFHRYYEGIHLANPGSPTLPRGGYAPSVMILEVDDNEIFVSHLAVMA